MSKPMLIIAFDDESNTVVINLDYVVSIYPNPGFCTYTINHHDGSNLKIDNATMRCILDGIERHQKEAMPPC